MMFKHLDIVPTVNIRPNGILSLLPAFGPVKELKMSGPTNAPVEAKRGAYVAPTLKVYGCVATMTASGTSGVSENGTTPACTPQTTRKPC